MGVRGLDWQTIQIPFVGGLDQKHDPRALEPPGLDICMDVQFDKVGGMQTRRAFVGETAAILGGGGLSNCRRLAVNGDELLLFTKDSLYSLSPGVSKWVLKGTHLAVKVEEESVFVTTDDQVDADRAGLGGITIYAWTSGTTTYVGARDSTTGAVTMSATAISGTATRPRLIAFTTKILLFFHDGSGNLKAYALTPSDPATALAGSATTILATNANLYYDVARVAATDTCIVGCRRTTTTSYSLLKVTTALAVTASTKARTCDGPIAVSVDPTGTNVQVVRANGVDVQGDLVSVSALSDVFTAQAIGAVSINIWNQIAACHRSVQDGGAYRCYVFWYSNEDAFGFDSESNWVDTAGTIGTENNRFVHSLAMASRAFDHDGRVYFWGVFAGKSATDIIQLQNTYFLYRDDGFLVGKAVTTRAGGFTSSLGHLPGVALTADVSGTQYAWCGTDRHIIPTGGGDKEYSARAPQDILFTFDSDEARRVARLGQTLYITGAEILQYDGLQLTEAGFHVYPHDFDTLEVAAGNLADGTYAYKITERWDNGRGEIDTSTTATIKTQAIASGPNGVQLPDWRSISITHKTSRPISMQVWRTAVNPGDDAPFYLASSLDPAVTSNPNRYVANDPTQGTLPTFNDELSDASLTTRATHPENGNVLENLAPPPATVILATEDRLFLGGVAGDQDRIWYSKQRSDGEVAAFHDALTINIPPVGGKITGLAWQDGVLVVFREAAIYLLPGSGFDNAGGGQNYGPAQRVPGDIGAVNQESIANTEEGTIFRSSNGWMILTRGFGLEAFGTPVEDFDSETPLAVNVMTSQSQVRFLSASRMLVFDTLVKQWSEWTISDGLDACMFQGGQVYLTSTGPKIQQIDSFSAVNYGMDIETAWIKLDGLQGFGRVRFLQILGEYRSAHHLRVRVARDYISDGAGGWTYMDDKFWAVTPTTVGGPEQVRHSPSVPQVQAIKVRLTAYATNDTDPPGGEALRLTGLALEVGRKQGLYKRLPAAQRE